MAATMFRFDNLQSVPDEDVHAAFLDAFSDYAVPMNMSLADMQVMHLRRGIAKSASIGAFGLDGKLAGFILNGDGIWDGLRCAYDGGTGVLPAFRGQGLSKAMAQEAKRRLKALGFKRWLLEVLVENEPAYKTYHGAGFCVTRRFACPRGTVADAPAKAAAAVTKAGVDIRPLGHRDTARFYAFRDWKPSWQNSDESLARTPEALVCLGAWDAKDGDSAPVGYIAATQGGSIFQLAVHPEHRARGVGRALACSVAATTPNGSLRYINIASEDEASLGLMRSLGVADSVDQWEMVLDLL